MAMSLQVTLTDSELFMLTCSLQYLERNAQMRIEEEFGAIAPLYNKLVSYREDAKRITRHGGDMDAL